MDRLVGTSTAGPPTPGRLGIRAQLLLWLMGTATVVLALAAVVDYHRQSAALSADGERAVGAALDRLEQVLPQAIWDLDPQAAANALHGELGDPRVAALEVQVEGRVLAKADQHPGQAMDPEAQVRRIDLVRAGPGGSVTIGHLSLTIDPEPLRQARRGMILLALIQTVAVNLVILLGVAVVVTRITRPIRELTRAAGAIAEGDLERPVQVGTRDEIGHLARSFDQMRSAIRRTIQTIEEQNRVLDQRVQERSRQLEAAQQELLEAANAAGKAEIATGVLHNIGNVLTGVFIELESLRRGQDPALPETVCRLRDLYRAHDADFAGFLARDPRGEAVPRLTALVLEQLGAERERAEGHLAKLDHRLGMIRDIVAVQQSHATGAGFVQVVDLQRELEDMILLHAAGLERRGIQVVRRYAEVPRVSADRAKVGHVLANLIKNAQEALGAAAEGSRIITLTLVQEGASVELAISDTGCGISSEDMERIFAHGFTTKRDGHGFGLHYCANAMQEMGGEIRCRSPGPGQGTTFTLTLAVAPVSGSTVATSIAGPPQPPAITHVGEGSRRASGRHRTGDPT